MACEEAYRGQCCCECNSRLTISMCSCGRCPTIEGYVCIVEHKVEDNYSCMYQATEHGLCEMFVERKEGKEMEHKYVCRECDDGACVLTIGIKADTMPDECPWLSGKAHWIDLEKPEDDKKGG